MIARSFVHLPGIGYGTELRLWRAGVCTWEDFLRLDCPPRRISAGRWDCLCGELQASVAALQAADHAYFSGRLPRRDHWRALGRFQRRTAYVDIETTGMGAYSEITLVGVYDGLNTRTYILGDNLDELEEDLARYALLVTFNGSAFDLPYLRRRFRRVAWDHLHVDLRYALRALGYRGGLKAIEREFGLRRSPEIADLDGFDAVRLWAEYRLGSDEALDLLVRYNTADIQNLEVLGGHVYSRLSEAMLRQMRGGERGPAS